jgi:asparagine synthase (glutamine-hydrolysing)
MYPKADWAPRIFRGKATFESLSCSHVEGYFRSMSAYRPNEKAQLLHPDVLKALNEYDSTETFRYYYEKADTNDPVSKIQYLDIKTYLTDDILVKVDRASMAHSLEVRAPLLDHKLMELIASMPSSLKLKGMMGKYILKKALHSLLPEEVLYRRKMGFAVPLAKWFREDLKEAAYETIVEAEDDCLLDKRFVNQIWRQHQNGFRDRSAELWGLLMFRLWQGTFLKTKTSAVLHDVSPR